MTLTPKKDLANPDYQKSFAVYADGGKDVFAVAKCRSLGLDRGWMV